MLRLLFANLIFGLIILTHSEQQFIGIRKNTTDIYEEVFWEGKLDSDFSDKIYNQKLCCKTELYVLQFTRKDQNHKESIVLEYSGFQPSEQDISVSVQKSGTPLPTLFQITPSNIFFSHNCPEAPSDSNYWSKVDMVVSGLRFSFRLHCDDGNRHKNFEWGYVIIMLINSTIMISVALHSRIWSIKLKNNRALGIPVKWVWISILTVIVIAVGGVLIYLDSNQRKGKVFGTVIEIVGNIIALVFCIIILDQIFFLVNKFKRKVYKFIRICDLLSLLVSAIIVTLFGVLPSISQNFIFNDILSVIISVGAIKLFKFLNLRDAILCCGIVFAAENITALFVHIFYHTMSYNDLFGATVNSPLVTQMSILSYSLYQKCSWLPVTEIVLPGITIAYLRRYDYSRDSKLYLLVGNLLFVLSTFVWILIQSLSIHSIPFSLITYPALFIPVMALAYKRAELKTLLNGKFYDPEFIDSTREEPINRPIDESQIQQSTLEGLIPQSDDMEKSEKDSI